MNKKIVIQLAAAALLLLFTGVMFFRHFSSSADALPEIREEMRLCLEDLRRKAYLPLAGRIIRLEETQRKVADPVIRRRLQESCALLAMIHAAMTGSDIAALQIFEERCRINAGRKIELLCFDELLPYAKFHVLNVFLKRFDMKGAFLFVNMYPAVEKGKHAAYFKAMDDFVRGDIPGALRQLERLQKLRPQDRMIANSIACIKRVEERKLLTTGPEEAEK